MSGFIGATPLRNPAVLSRKTGEGEMVLVNADNSTSLALTNLAAVLIWEAADGKNSVQQIIAQVARRFQDVPDTVTEDVQNLLELLARDGFIGLEWTVRQ